ncbi:unnamed protein product [Vitrella brassicaformis CCMP3155]|uniref:Multidrug and toxin extrusion protein n=2 Tax=Vitrella brassicaformis TaxID=1169539 RepID=A0A0G4F5X5_VITBC|nr:unnamed protein product [Vitrella brassicaformis CCMP3155]|eukprot:CEM07622.1 unnamed protein product [Vitrella brassicaformis CCMP3155]
MAAINIEGQPSDGCDVATVKAFQLPWLDELKELMHLALPSIASNLLFMSALFINALVVERYGDAAQVGALGLANTIGTACCLSIILGLLGALDTLCSQAHGASQPRLVGLYLHRARLIISLAFIPLAILLSYSRDLLLWMGQDHHIATIAGAIVNWNTVAYFANGQAEATRRFLQAQGHTKPGLWVALLTLPVHVLMVYLMVIRGGQGAVGTGIATCISNVFNFIVLQIYVVVSGVAGESWIPFCAASFDRREMCAYLRLSIPAASLVCLEWWAFEIMALEAGALGKTQLAAHVAAYNVTALCYMPPAGFGVAAATAIGNAVGGRRVKQAKKYFALVVTLDLLLFSVICSCLFVYRDTLSLVLSPPGDIKVQAVVQSLLAPLAFFEIFDSLNGTLAGVLRGLSKQGPAGALNLVLFYVVLQPLSYWMAFVLRWAALGLWIAIGIILMIQIGFYFGIIFSTDWSRVADEAANRMAATSIKDAECDGTTDNVSIRLPPKRTKSQLRVDPNAAAAADSTGTMASPSSGSNPLWRFFLRLRQQKSYRPLATVDDEEEGSLDQDGSSPFSSSVSSSSHASDGASLVPAQQHDTPDTRSAFKKTAKFVRFSDDSMVVRIEREPDDGGGLVIETSVKARSPL